MFIRIMKSNKYIDMDDVRRITIHNDSISLTFKDGSKDMIRRDELNLSIRKTADRLEEIMKLCNLNRASEFMSMPNAVRQSAWEEFRDYVCDIPRL